MRSRIIDDSEHGLAGARTLLPKLNISSGEATGRASDLSVARQLAGPRMFKLRISLAECLARGSAEIASNRGGGNSARTHVRDKDTQVEAPNHKREVGLRMPELERRRRVHPRLRWPRLATTTRSGDLHTTGIIPQTPSEVVDGDVSGRVDLDVVFGDARELCLNADRHSALPTISGRGSAKVVCGPNDGIDSGPHSPSSFQGDVASPLLPRVNPMRSVFAGAATTIHTPRPSSKSDDHRSWQSRKKAREGKEDDTTQDRKYFLRQAPMSHVVASDAQSAMGTERSASHHWRHGRTSSEYVNFEGWGLDDKYVESLCSRVDFATMLHVNMSDNRLTERSVSILCESSGEHWLLQSLQLSRNCLRPCGNNAIANLIRTKKPPLRHLDLEGNQMADPACILLVEALSVHCRELIGLGLAHNRLGHTERLGVDLGRFVGTARCLTTLDLRWNILHGTGAVQLLSGIYENDVIAQGNLRRLDLSWNRLGMRCGGASDEPLVGSCSACACTTCVATVRVAKMLASIFQEGKMLFHLDLSYNGITASECTILANALKVNHTLFGIHIVGNEARMDALGFLIPCPPLPSAVVDREERQRKTNDFSTNIPMKLRLDAAMPSPRKPSQQVQSLDGGGSVEGPRVGSLVAQIVPHCSGSVEEESKFVLGCQPTNPAMQRLVVKESVVAPFSKEDIESEKEWAALRSCVHQPIDFGAPAHEDVRSIAQCCWICENWIEQRISYVVGWSGPEVSADEVVSVVAFFSIDDFKVPLRLTRVEEAFQRRLLEKERNKNCHRKDGKLSVPLSRGIAMLSQSLRTPCLTSSGRMVRWVGMRRFPPSLVEIQVVFQVNGHIRIAEDMTSRPLERGMHIDLEPTPGGLASNGGVSVGDGGGDEGGNDTLVASSGCDGVEGSRTGDEGEAAKGSQPMIHSVNLLAVWISAYEGVQRGKFSPLCLLENPKRRSLASVRPRVLDEDPPAACIPKLWCFEDSIWSSYSRGRPVDCFEVDWKLTRLAKVSKDAQKDLYNSSVLRESYAGLVLAFHVFCFKSFQTTQPGCSMQMLTFSELLMKYGGGVSPKTLRMATAFIDGELNDASTVVVSDLQAGQTSEVCPLSSSMISFRRQHEVLPVSATGSHSSRSAHTQGGDVSPPTSRRTSASGRPGTSSRTPRAGSRPTSSASSMQRIGSGSPAVRRKLFNRSFKTSDADAIYIAACVVENRKERQKELRAVAEKGLARFQFLEAIVRVANRRFAESGECAGIVEATEMLVGSLQIGRDLLEFQSELQKDLFCEECDMVYKEYRSLLDAIYAVYRKVKPLPGRRGCGLSFGAWTELVQDVGIAEIGIRDKEAVGRAFALGREIRLDEYSSLRHMELSFTEFLVCLGALMRLRPDHDDEMFADRLCDFFREQLSRTLQMRQNSSASSVGLDSFAPIYALAARVFEEADDDQSGQLNTRELKAIVSRADVQREFRDLGMQGEDVSALLFSFDTNHSGGVTLSEFCDGFSRLKLALRESDRAVAYFRRVFTESDLDGSGTLDPIEFRQLVDNEKVIKRLAGFGVSRDEVEAMLETLEFEGNSISSTKAISVFLEIRRRGSGESRGMRYLRQLFLEADEDTSGTLSRNEIETMFVKNGEVVRQFEKFGLKVPDWLGVFDALDIDGDGFVSWEELNQGICEFWRQDRNQVRLTVSDSIYRGIPAADAPASRDLG